MLSRSLYPRLDGQTGLLGYTLSCEQQVDSVVPQAAEVHVASRNYARGAETKPGIECRLCPGAQALQRQTRRPLL